MIVGFLALRVLQQLRMFIDVVTADDPTLSLFSSTETIVSNEGGPDKETTALFACLIDR